MSVTDKHGQNSGIIFKKAAEFEEQNQNRSDKLRSLQEELRLLEQPVQELEPLGRGATACGNCHHKGHRNDARHACEYVSCVGFDYCSQTKLHAEHTQKLNEIKRKVNQLKKDIDKGKESIKVISEFESKSEAYFFQEMTPRLKVLNWNRYKNRANLFRDLRILRSAFNCNVPTKGADDRNFLKSILEREHAKINQTSGKFVIDDSYDGTKASPIKFSSTSRKRLTYEKQSGDSSVNESDSDSSISDSSSSFSETSYDRYKDKTAKSLKRKRAHFRKKRKIGVKRNFENKNHHLTISQISEQLILTILIMNSTVRTMDKVK